MNSPTLEAGPNAAMDDGRAGLAELAQGHLHEQQGQPNDEGTGQVGDEEGASKFKKMFAWFNVFKIFNIFIFNSDSTQIFVWKK